MSSTQIDRIYALTEEIFDEVIDHMACPGPVCTSDIRPSRMEVFYTATPTVVEIVTFIEDETTIGTVAEIAYHNCGDDNFEAMVTVTSPNHGNEKHEMLVLSANANDFVECVARAITQLHRRFDFTVFNLAQEVA